MMDEPWSMDCACGEAACRGVIANSLDMPRATRMGYIAQEAPSGTATPFETVLAGDTTADLDFFSTTALALNAGTIKDAAGNNATLTLAAPTRTPAVPSHSPCASASPAA